METFVLDIIGRGQEGTLTMKAECHCSDTQPELGLNAAQAPLLYFVPSFSSLSLYQNKAEMPQKKLEKQREV